MKIAELQERFEYYAAQHKQIKHDPTNKKERAFSHFTLSNLTVLNKTGLKYPCLFFKTPEVEKDGNFDGMVENYDCSFFVVVPVAKGDDSAKAAAFDLCKQICDDLLIRVTHDISLDVFDGVQVGTSEGEVGPVIDNCFGWGVVFTIAQGFDGELKSEIWEDLD